MSDKKQQDSNYKISSKRNSVDFITKNKNSLKSFKNNIDSKLVPVIKYKNKLYEDIESKIKFTD
jgi:hypothetical protein